MRSAVKTAASGCDLVEVVEQHAIGQVAPKPQTARIGKIAAATSHRELA